MKRFLIVGSSLLVAIFAVGTTNASAQAQKYGFINSSQIVAQAPGAAEARQSLEAEMQGYRTELDKLEAQLDSLQTTYERQQASLSATARQQRQQELQQKFAAYQQRAAELQQTAQRREQELVAPIMQRIGGVIEEVRKEGGYALIFDAAAAGVIVAADPALDLTEQVLAKLRAAAPAGN
jgi:outer membrane protein